MVFTSHGSVVINAACETNDLNFEVAVDVELYNLPNVYIKIHKKPRHYDKIKYDFPGKSSIGTPILFCAYCTRF